MRSSKILFSLVTLGMLLLSACAPGQIPILAVPNSNANVQLLSNQPAGLDDTASRAGVTDSSELNAGVDDGTADQGTGDVVAAGPTVTAIAPASDDGTADQGSGDVLVMPAELNSTPAASDDGTADQGHGDVSATAGPVANLGAESEFTGVITAVGNGFITLNGQTVFIGTGTEVTGTLEPNSTIKVHVFVDGNGALSAREVKVLVAADGTIVDDSGSDDGAAHDANDDHGGQSNPGSGGGSSNSNSGPSGSSGQSSGGGNSGSGNNSGGGNSGSSGGHGGGSDDGSNHP